MDLEFESSLESVEKAEEIVRRVAGRLGLENDELDRLGLAVHETMVNAVVHGNRYNKHKKVHLSLRNDADRIIITVVDQGEGFDLGSVPDPLNGDNLLRASGRGLLLIRAFVDECEVRKAQPGGTEVKLVKFVRKPEIMGETRGGLQK